MAPTKKNSGVEDLWPEEGGTKSVHRPQPIRTSATWTLAPDGLPINSADPRRRKAQHVKPNLRAAVSVPHSGQSYNPRYEDHQAAVGVAVKSLLKKKKAHDRVVKLLTLGRDQEIKGNFSADKTWEEEVQEHKPVKSKSPAAQQDQNGKKKKKKKKPSKKVAADAAKKALPHRRHPDRDAALKQVDEIDSITKEVQKKVLKRERTAAKKKITRKEAQQTKNFGRYHHTPLVLDVATTDKLVGSVRHLNGSYVHPALDRIKSLEERNLIPARMRHTFNKRKLLKPKGEVRLKTESFGILPETSH